MKFEDILARRARDVSNKPIPACKICSMPAHFNGIAYSNVCHRDRCRDRWEVKQNKENKL